MSHGGSSVGGSLVRSGHRGCFAAIIAVRRRFVHNRLPKLPRPARMTTQQIFHSPRWRGDVSSKAQRGPLGPFVSSHELMRTL